MLLSGLATLPAQPVPAAYVRLEGAVSSEDPGRRADAYHIDAYQLSAEGGRQLVRTNRFSTPGYHLYLKADADYEITISQYGHAPYTAKLSKALLQPARGQVLRRDWRLQPLQAVAEVPPAPSVPAASPIPVPALTDDFVAEAGPAIPQLVAPAGAVEAEVSAEAPRLPVVAVSEVPDARQEGQPTDPRYFKSVVRTDMPPTPRRARLRRGARVVAGLHGKSREEVIARLSAGQVLRIVEYTTPEWWMVAHGALFGWVRAASFE